MASLYEIEREMLDCIDLDTGEVIDTERLDALRMERGKKLESVALWIKNLESDIAAYEAEMEAFAARRKQAERKVESLCEYLKNALQGEKFSTAKCLVSFRKSQAVDIENEEDFKEWAFHANKLDLLSYPQPKVNRTAVKKALNAGEAVPGAALVERLNINIK